MTYRGHVRNGVVVLDEPADLTDGTPVSVRPLRRAAKSSKGRKRPRTLYDTLKPIIGKAKGLPPDASINLHHYLYGQPKREK